MKRADSTLCAVCPDSPAPRGFSIVWADAALMRVHTSDQRRPCQTAARVAVNLRDGRCLELLMSAAQQPLSAKPMSLAAGAFAGDKLAVASAGVLQAPPDTMALCGVVADLMGG